jgi:hypothetical protein
MVDKIKQFFKDLWSSIEASQMARAEAMLKNHQWRRWE